jgi:hypothetical protein
MGILPEARPTDGLKYYLPACLPALPTGRQAGEIHVFQAKCHFNVIM